MEILFNEQDLRNSICVATAISHNGGRFKTSRPEDVTAEVLHNHHGGFFAWGEIDFDRYEFDQDQVIDAIGKYLHHYHSFEPSLLAVNLNRSHEGELSAQIVTLR